jgi:hypothetical protein
MTPREQIAHLRGIQAVVERDIARTEALVDYCQHRLDQHTQRALELARRWEALDVEVFRLEPQASAEELSKKGGGCLARTDSQPATVAGGGVQVCPAAHRRGGL